MQLCRTQSQSGEVCETRRTTTQLEMQQEQKKLQQQQQQELGAEAGSRSWEPADVANKPALTGEWAGQQCARVKNPSRETPQNTAQGTHTLRQSTHTHTHRAQLNTQHNARSEAAVLAPHCSCLSLCLCLLHNLV